MGLRAKRGLRVFSRIYKVILQGFVLCFLVKCRTVRFHLEGLG